MASDRNRHCDPNWFDPTVALTVGLGMIVAIYLATAV
jgi:hypothetical protein